MPSSTFTIAIEGSGGCGKTAFINKHKTGVYTSRYTESTDAELTSIPLHTSTGLITLDILDCPGNFSTDANYRGIDGAILMFDLTSIYSYGQIPAIYEYLRVHRPRIPVVICGNKWDCRDEIIEQGGMAFPHFRQIQYHDISTKTGYNIEKPLLSLLRKLTGNPELYLTESLVQLF